MANVPGKFYSAETQRRGVTPVSPPYAGDEPSNPVNPIIPTSGIGIRLNGQVIRGVKRLIELTDILDIPIYWEYNVFHLDVNGLINLDGEINVI